jgi:hypothetical protein
MAKLEDLITENGRYVVELERPILIEGESQSRLLLKAPTLAHVMGLEKLKSDSERAISLICALADIPPSSARAHGGVPGDWGDLIGDLAATFHFQPSELYRMTAQELRFWHNQKERILEQIQRQCHDFSDR